MDRTDHPSILARNSEVFVLNIGTSTNVTGEGVVCGINLL